MALAFEPGEPGVLRRAPRSPGEGILTRLLWERTLVAGAMMSVAALVLFRWELDTTGSLTRAQTVALTTLVVSMALHVGNSRAESASVLAVPPLSNRVLAVGTAVALAVHVAALYLPPTQYVLRVEPIEWAAWARIVVASTAVLVVVEVDKALRRARATQPATGRPSQRPGRPSQRPGRISSVGDPADQPVGTRADQLSR